MIPNAKYQMNQLIPAEKYLIILYLRSGSRVEQKRQNAT